MQQLIRLQREQRAARACGSAPINHTSDDLNSTHPTVTTSDKMEREDAQQKLKTGEVTLTYLLRRRVKQHPERPP